MSIKCNKTGLEYHQVGDVIKTCKGYYLSNRGQLIVRGMTPFKQEPMVQSVF